MQKYINLLKKGLKLSVIKKNDSGRSSSIAFSSAGRSYLAGSLSSDTHLLNTSSEQAALVLAVHNNDFKVNRVITMTENNCSSISPLVVKMLIDHQARTGMEIEYTVLDSKGRLLFQMDKLDIPFYQSPGALIAKRRLSKNCVNGRNNLKKYALLGTRRNFPTYNSASGYGAAILTNRNNLYFGGQYSSFDKRIGLHAEMAVSLNALMNGEKITHLGLVSTKHENEPCEICGCCRQFLSELVRRQKLDIKFFCFALKGGYREYTINQLLPNQWSSERK